MRDPRSDPRGLYNTPFTLTSTTAFAPEQGVLEPPAQHGCAAVQVPTNAAPAAGTCGIARARLTAQRSSTIARSHASSPPTAARVCCLRRCGAAPRVTPQAPRVHISPLMTSRHLVRRTASSQQHPSHLGTEHAACCVTPLTSNAVPPVTGAMPSRSARPVTRPVRR